jgi:hypothetical protein
MMKRRERERERKRKTLLPYNPYLWLGGQEESIILLLGFYNDRTIKYVL